MSKEQPSLESFESLQASYFEPYESTDGFNIDDLYYLLEDVMPHLATQIRLRDELIKELEAVNTEFAAENLHLKAELFKLVKAAEAVSNEQNSQR